MNRSEVKKNNPQGQSMHIDQPISRGAKRRMRRRLQKLEKRKPGSLKKHGIVIKNELDLVLMQTFVHEFEKAMAEGCDFDTAKEVANYHLIAKGGPGSGCSGDNCGRPKGSGSENSSATVGGKKTKVDFKVKDLSNNQKLIVVETRNHSFSVPIHPEHWNEIKNIESGKKDISSFKDETGTTWGIQRSATSGVILSHRSIKGNFKVHLTATTLEDLDSRASVKKNSERLEAHIFKAEKHKQIVYGVVLTPDEVDTQEDFMTADEIEKTAHAYMLNSRVVGSGHTKTIKARPVESYIAPMDMHFDSGLYGSQLVKKGAWVLGVKVDDPKEWDKVLAGYYTGYSIGGVGIREKT